MISGLGILRGLWITFRHFVTTYLEDIQKGRKRYHTKEGIEMRRKPDMRGIVTIQYPEEKMPVPEEFRYLPFLLYEEGPEGEKNYRCTACGSVQKFAHQCIWIVRVDPVTGRPITQPRNTILT